MSATPIRFLDVAGMVAKAPLPVAWLARPILPRAALTAVYAPGGDGKSLFSMALAAAIALGEELAGIECEQGASIYLDGENGEHEIHRRVHTLGLPASGVMVGDASSLNLRRDIEAVQSLVADAHPDLLILDSLRSLTPEMDENDTAQTARVLDPLRRIAHQTGVAILLIHHANKNGRDFRGASSIRDSVDVLWHLGRREKDPDPRRRFLACCKMRVAAEPVPLWLRLEIDRGHVLIERADSPEEHPATATQPVRAKLSDEIDARMTETPLRLAQIAELVGRNPKDGSVRNALTALVRDGLLTRDGNSYRKVRTVQTGRLHPCTESSKEVQGAIPHRGAAPLHPTVAAIDADTEPAHIGERFEWEAR